jgi:hypothetical protein
MQTFVNLFGPVDAVLAPWVEYVVLGLVLINLVTRHLAHRRHVAQARDGADAVDRYLPHVASNVLLVLGSFYFMTVDRHSGLVLSMLTVGLFLADFFEFEARSVELREGEPLERPKGAITASLLVVLYAAYQALFFVVAPLWNAVI